MGQVTKQHIVDKAREYLGTKFQHQARLKGVAVDCIGLLVGIAQELDLFNYDNRDYQRRSDGTLLMAELKKVMHPIALDAARPGDLLVFWIQPGTKHAQHIGIKTDKGLIHTHEGVGKVVETPLSGNWPRRLKYAFAFRGVV